MPAALACEVGGITVKQNAGHAKQVGQYVIAVRHAIERLFMFSVMEGRKKGWPDSP